MESMTQIAEMMSKLVQAKMDEQEITLTVIEQTTKAMLQEIGRLVVENLAQVMEAKYPNEVSCQKCAVVMDYVQQRQMQTYTLFGKVKIRRGYYRCVACHSGCSPLDKKLGLRPNALSAELARLIAMTGVQLPFEMAAELFAEIGGIRVSDQMVGKAVRQIGRHVEQQESKWQVLADNDEQLLQIERNNPAPNRLYGSIDATKVHTRTSDEHHWRDLKVLAWYVAKGEPPKDPNGDWHIRAQQISYAASICSAAEFGHLFWATGVQRQAQQAQELVMIGDGADWIWNLVKTRFPQAIQILDWFHAVEYLLPVAQAIFEETHDQQACVHFMKSLLWEGQVHQVIDFCRTHALHATVDTFDTTANYFENNAHRMRYAFFREQGFQIGSGTIESAAKQIGLMRMKVPGAIWNEQHAPLVAKARAAFLSDRWHSLPLAV